MSEIQKFGHSDDLKAIRRLLKEIFFFASDIANSDFVSNDIKNYCGNIKECINQALKSGLLSHEAVSQVNGQLFLIKRELNEIDRKASSGFRR
jgi:hypothetical protein